MQPTRSGRVTIPEDPEELRALLRERMRERDKKNINPHESPSKDKAPKEGQGTKEPRKMPTKQAGQKTKPYRLIFLTGEEARAIDEGRLTMEEVKAHNVMRDDDIPKVQITTKARSQETSSGTSSGWVHETGPYETPAEAGEIWEMRRVHRQDQSKPRHESRPSRSMGRVHEIGPDETPAEAGEHSESGRVHGEDQSNTRQQSSTDTSSARVHNTGPNETPTEGNATRTGSTKGDG